MLYIFTRNNGVQIAWDSKAPHRHNDNRRPWEVFSRLGLVRTSNAG